MYSQSPYWQSELPFESDNSQEAYESLKAFNSSNNNLQKGFNNYTHKLDSLYGYNGQILLAGKTEFIYTPEKDFLVSFDYDSENENFQPSTILVYHYEDNLLKRRSYKTWDGNYDNLNDSDPLVLLQMEYDDNNLLIELRASDQNDFILGGKGNRTVYTYDENNLPTGRLVYFWSYETNSYELSSETIYRNNQKGLLSEIVNLKYREEYGWTQEDSTVYIYNNVDQLNIEDHFSKGPILDTFYYGSQYIYHYDINGAIDKIDEFNGPTGQGPNIWYQQNLREYNYFSYGSLEGVVLLNVNDSYYQYYDQEYERSSYKYNDLVEVNKIWFPRVRFSEFSFDDHYYEEHMLTEETHFRGGNQFEAQYAVSRKKYFYSELETSTSDDLQSDDPITIYPNPASDFLKIDLPFTAGKIDLSLTDITGKVVKSQSFQNGQDISIADLDVGLYFYTVTYNGSQKTGKLVVER